MYRTHACSTLSIKMCIRIHVRKVQYTIYLYMRCINICMQSTCTVEPKTNERTKKNSTHSDAAQFENMVHTITPSHSHQCQWLINIHAMRSHKVAASSSYIKRALTLYADIFTINRDFSKSPIPLQ